MKAKGLIVMIGMAIAVGAGSRSNAAPASSGAYHIVLPGRAIGAGESLNLRVEPPPPAGARVSFGISSGTFAWSAGAVYRAPYLIPAGTPPVKVVGSILGSDLREMTPEVSIELAPGAVPGASDCLGPNQSFSVTEAGLNPQYVYIDELPSAIHKVWPVYPRSQYVRGVTDTVIVRVLLCKTGRVLDAIALQRFRDPRGAPLYDDPKLVDAALAAARQWVFSPALANGVAVACFVVIPMPFPL